MLTFISGWRSVERDKALVRYRDPNRRAVFFVNDSTRFDELLPDAPIIDVWRNGTMDFQIDPVPETLVRLNYDTDHDVLTRALVHVMLIDRDAQVVVTYDALQHLYRLFPALRQINAVLAADERLDAPPGDYVLFTRGGSFAWKDHVLEGKTALLTDSEVIDGGVIPETEFLYD